MSDATTWLQALLTVGVLVLYEGALLLVQWRHPARLARLAHADLREEWLSVLSEHPGSEVLAVQTLRNSLMAATMTASTAALGLMGAVTLAAPSLNSTLGAASAAHFTARLALELVLMTLLFSSLVCSAMAARYYNHAGFICAMPVNSQARQRWGPIGAVYLRRAGLLYSWGLRNLLMVAPILAFIVYPWAGPAAAVIVVVALVMFDSFSVR